MVSLLQIGKSYRLLENIQSYEYAPGCPFVVIPKGELTEYMGLGPTKHTSYIGWQGRQFFVTTLTYESKIAALPDVTSDKATRRECYILQQDMQVVGPQQKGVWLDTNSLVEFIGPHPNDPWQVIIEFSKIRYTLSASRFYPNAKFHSIVYRVRYEYESVEGVIGPKSSIKNPDMGPGYKPLSPGYDERYEGRNGTIAYSSMKNPQMGPGYKQLEVGYDDPTGDDFLVGVN